MLSLSLLLEDVIVTELLASMIHRIISIRQGRKESLPDLARADHTSSELWDILRELLVYPEPLNHVVLILRVVASWGDFPEDSTMTHFMRGLRHVKLKVSPRTLLQVLVVDNESQDCWRHLPVKMKSIMRGEEWQCMFSQLPVFGFKKR